jgi:hypothetical protein
MGPGVRVDSAAKAADRELVGATAGAESDSAE